MQSEIGLDLMRFTIIPVLWVWNVSHELQVNLNVLVINLHIAKLNHLWVQYVTLCNWSIYEHDLCLYCTL